MKYSRLLVDVELTNQALKGKSFDYFYFHLKARCTVLETTVCSTSKARNLRSCCVLLVTNSCKTKFTFKSPNSTPKIRTSSLASRLRTRHVDDCTCPTRRSLKNRRLHGNRSFFRFDHFFLSRFTPAATCSSPSHRSCFVQCVSRPRSGREISENSAPHRPGKPREASLSEKRGRTAREWVGFLVMCGVERERAAGRRGRRASVAERLVVVDVK